MNYENIAESLKKSIDKERVLLNEPMADHTSFRIGGPADILVLPSSVEEIRIAVYSAKENNIPCHVIGNGSNLLVCDAGIEGMVIELGENFNHVTVAGNCLKVQSGALLSVIANYALNASLKGFEFAGGIPGTLGGAIVMNAGAYGGEMKDVVTKVTVLTQEGNIVELSREEVNFGYRHSCIPENGYIVVGAEIQLETGQYESIAELSKELTLKRTSKQPLHLPSAGSTFKRPTGHYAGQLVEEAGLKGLRYGDAQVSPKHSGFVVNLGKATCNDVYTLIRLVRRMVFNQFNVELEPEVRLIGRRFDVQDHC